MSTQTQQVSPNGPQGRAAIEAAALRCIPGLKALLLRLTGNVETANELAQDVVFAVILAIRDGRLSDPALVSAYTRQAARNAAAMLARKQKPLLLPADAAEREALWAQRVPTPLEHYETEQLRELARRVLDELPTQRDRDLIIGYYVDGSSKLELMEKLGFDRDQFDRVMSRARGRMRDLFNTQMNKVPAPVREMPYEGISSGQNPAKSP